MQDTYDVIVVGGGGSGLAAAYSAAEHGARVLVLERQPQPGGTTGIAVGSFTSSGTSLQRAAAIEDDAETHALDAAKFPPAETEARNSAAMRAFFLREAAATFEWLRGLGLSFVGPSPEPPNQQPRMHNVVPGAKAYIAALQLALVRRGAKLVCDAAVESLLRDGPRVVGVRANVRGAVREYKATRGVILAAGDYAGNAAMIATYKGQEFRQIEGINPFACGDGQRLASEAGAEMLNMDVTYGPELRFVASHKKPFQQTLPAGGPLARIMGFVAPRLPNWVLRAMIKRLLVTWQHPENSLFTDGAILLNRDGERFVNETTSPAREISLAAQAGKVGYILLDERLIERYSAWPNFISTAPDIAYAYVADYRRLRPDVTHSGRDLEAACRRAGLDTASVARSVAGFNEYVDGKCDDAFGRRNDKSRLGAGRCVLLGPVKAYFTTTEGGALVSERMEVMDTSGDVIPGLYAVGQNGLSGMILWSHGLHIAWAMTSGRLVGAAVMIGDPP
jgi:fumarate reductase flavoprotein subunit